MRIIVMSRTQQTVLAGVFASRPATTKTKTMMMMTAGNAIRASRLTYTIHAHMCVLNRSAEQCCQSFGGLLKRTRHAGWLRCFAWLLYTHTHEGVLTTLTRSWTHCRRTSTVSQKPNTTFFDFGRRFWRRCILCARVTCVCVVLYACMCEYILYYIYIYLDLTSSKVEGCLSLERQSLVVRTEHWILMW